MQPAEDLSSPATSVLYLPDTLKDWPWKRTINPHYQEVHVECEAWISKFMPFLTELHIADINALAQPTLFVSLCFPFVTKELLMVASRFCYMAFLVDACTDCQPASTVTQVCKIVCHALDNPGEDRAEGELFIGQITKEFWQSALKTTSSSKPRCEIPAHS
ncbi:hypothetical protein AX14_006620 [Amanita brunnescens Koide BX004]|nr:hypothetical protein AX14_006620 [Amanita brunnescens Koide BX004]